MAEKIVNFTLDNEDFGLRINEVLEIIPYRDSVSIPGSHTDLDGVVDIRGEVVPVLCLRAKMGLKTQEISKESRIVLVEFGDGKLGLKVDSVKNVIELKDERITESPRIFEQLNVTYIDAFGKINSHLMIMVNLDGLFANYSLEEVVSKGRISLEKFESMKETQVKKIKSKKINQKKKANRKKTKSKKITSKSKEKKNSNIVCRVCEKEFMNERGLNIHTTKVHSK